ncbi:hypothetical protein EV132_117120 [Rhizobium sullae]|uniref:Uncharacterized protein n=2 Tax=Rhizobium sullae TaxID=50338 RepID=A0A4R3PUV7_RHISU|nr:hypothetical protein EV132_117120 [Rhizobium sullae]
MAGWAAVAALLLLPLFAMQFTDGVNWDVVDFSVFGAMLLGVGVTYELAVRMTGSSAYRAAVGVAVAAAFLLVWINLAVGIIGSEDNAANLMYGGVLAIAVIGAANGRFQSAGKLKYWSVSLHWPRNSDLRRLAFQKPSCSRPGSSSRCGFYRHTYS